MPIASSTPAAFFDFGGLKYGTPFETASTPVSAVQPEANARSSRKTAVAPEASAACTCRLEDSATTGWPSSILMRPTLMSRSTEKMNR